METTPIQHIADTSFWVASYRAKESERPDALFKDPLAKVLSAGRGEAIAKEMGNEKVMAWMMSMRTLVIDQFVEQAIARGANTVLNLGAGLDTRPYRLNIPSSLTWIEADFASVIDYKNETLKAETPKCKLERVAIDLSQENARKKFLADVASVAGRKILVITEGVVIYLPTEEVAKLARDLSAHAEYAFWVVDYFSPMFKNFYDKNRGRMHFKKNKPFLFWPENFEKFFNDGGWQIKKIEYIAERGFELKRFPPTPLLFKLLIPFIPAKAKEKFRKMTGYTMMERKS